MCGQSAVLVRMLCEGDVSVIGCRPFFRIVHVGHDRNSIDQGGIFSERIPLVIQDVPFFVHPSPDVLCSAFKNIHFGEIRVGMFHEGCHWREGFPDGIERSDRNVPQEGTAGTVYPIVAAENGVASMTAWRSLHMATAGRCHAGNPASHAMVTPARASGSS